MPRYLRFEKKTSRGVLAHDVALDGLVLRQRSRRGVNKKTGAVGTGSARSTTVFSSQKAADAQFAKVLNALRSEHFVQVSGPPIASAPEKPRTKRFVCEGTARPTSAADLDRFEGLHHVRLPPSYRRFAMKYGAGELLGFVRVHVPRTKGRGQLEALLRRRAAAFFPFADTGGGDQFGWLLPSGAVFHLEGGAPRPRKVSADFASFVRALTTNQRFVDRLFPGLDADPCFRAH